MGELRKSIVRVFGTMSGVPAQLRLDWMPWFLPGQCSLVSRPSFWMARESLNYARPVNHSRDYFESMRLFA